MPGGKYDSSKTRVAPLFSALWAKGRNWLPDLLALPEEGSPDAKSAPGDLTLKEGYWEGHPAEKCLNPPVSLLSWMIRNAASLRSMARELDGRRQLLAAGDPETVQNALQLLRSENESRGWYIFEGPTCPDAFLIAEDALVVVEGKRTEAGTTVETKWLPGRHQIWRHIDAAWEIRGRRAVYGLLIVESDPDSRDGAVPEVWYEAGRSCLYPDALSTSFPHRSALEVAAISSCFLGVTTWRKVCERFQIDWKALPHEVTSPGS